jgi:hypothetical protein
MMMMMMMIFIYVQRVAGGACHPVNLPKGMGTCYARGLCTEYDLRWHFVRVRMALLPDV